MVVVVLWSGRYEIGIVWLSWALLMRKSLVRVVVCDLGKLDGLMGWNAEACMFPFASVVMVRFKMLCGGS